MNKAILKLSEGYSCVIEKENKIVAQESGSGVHPLLLFLGQGGYEDGDLADTVIGKAAAILCVQLRLRAVYGEVMSQSGYEYLKGHNILASYGTLVAHIENRTGDGWCPLEKAVHLIEEPQAGEKIIRETVKRLQEQ